jgi:hypothetical protein
LRIFATSFPLKNQVLLYQVLESDKNVQQQLYQAHVNGDYETKQAIHSHYFPQTAVALKV